MQTPEMQDINHTKLDQFSVNIRPDLGKAEHSDRNETLGDSKIHPDVFAAEPDDAGAERAVLHPTEVPPPSPYAQSRPEKIQAIEDFNGRLVSMGDSEYGDWMRRANMYWWHLVEALHGENNPEISRSLHDIHRMIQFNPDWSITETQRKVIAMSQKIERLLGGKPKFEEMPVPVTGTDRRQAPDYSLKVADRKEADISALTADGSNQGFVGKG